MAIISNEYRFNDLKLNLSLLQNIIEITVKTGAKIKAGSLVISNTAPTTAN